MKTTLAIALVMLCLGASLPASGQRTRKDPTDVRSFWSAFQSAVASSDREAVASMTHFPLEMPYGVRSIRTKAQFVKSYSKIFDAETKKCFATARPNREGANNKRFWIGCGEAMMYWFGVVNGKYKFISFDNVNE